jgi:hypothetical protein
MLNSLNLRLIKTLGIAWLAFLTAGLLIAATTPSTTVLIDRSFCSPTAWQQVVTRYEQLYQQHQRRSVQIKSVVLFSDLGEEVRSQPPTPAEIAALSTYGQKNTIRQQKLQHSYANSQILKCQ